jgi:primosomal protein N'
MARRRPDDDDELTPRELEALRPFHRWVEAQVDKLKSEALRQKLAHVRRNIHRRGEETAAVREMRAKIARAVTRYRAQYPKRPTSRMVADVLAGWDHTAPRRRPSRSTFYAHLQALNLR